MKTAPYQQLQDRHIRIAILEAGDWDDEIKVNLKEVLLGESRDYEPLSYHWGGSVATLSAIQLDGVEHYVTTDLESAIRHLRLPKNQRSLWIDQICINQSDIQEKTSQILLMREIYGHASNLLIWLGLPIDDTPLAFESINTIAEFLEKLNPGGNLHTDPQYYIAVAAQLINREVHFAIRKLCDRPWWYRVWVVQELFAANNLRTVVCGALSVDWSRLERAYMAVLKTKNPATTPRHRRPASSEEGNPVNNNNPESLQAPVHNVMEWTPLPISLDAWRANRSHVRLFDLVQEFRFRHTSDDRDRVFALCGLCEPHNIDGFVIDYAQSVADVYIQLATFHITTHNDLSLLAATRWQPPASRKYALPSWVPDCSSRGPKRRGLMRWSITAPADPSIQWYRATTATTAICRIEEPGRMLAVTAVKRTHRITALQPIWPNDYDSALGMLAGIRAAAAAGGSRTQRMAPIVNQLVHCFSCFDAAEKLAMGLGDGNAEAPYRTGETLRSAFWRTAICNRKPHGGAVSEEVEGKAYASFRQTAAVAVRRAQVTRERQIGSMAGGRAFSTALGAFAVARAFFVTDDGFMGLAPQEAEVGDHVVLVLGVPVPLVLRPGDGEKWIVVGECYAHGLMEGEAFEVEEEVETEELVLE